MTMSIQSAHVGLSKGLLIAGLDMGCLNEWSEKFLADIADKDGPLSKKQWECLARIAATVQAEEHAHARVMARASREAAE